MRSRSKRSAFALDLCPVERRGNRILMEVGEPLQGVPLVVGGVLRQKEELHSGVRANAATPRKHCGLGLAPQLTGSPARRATNVAGAFQCHFQQVGGRPAAFRESRSSRALGFQLVAGQRNLRKKGAGIALGKPAGRRARTHLGGRNEKIEVPLETRKPASPKSDWARVTPLSGNDRNAGFGPSNLKQPKPVVG